MIEIEIGNRNLLYLHYVIEGIKGIDDISMDVPKNLFIFDLPYVEITDLPHRDSFKVKILEERLFMEKLNECIELCNQHADDTLFYLNLYYHIMTNKTEMW